MRDNRIRKIFVVLLVIGLVASFMAITIAVDDQIDDNTTPDQQTIQELHENIELHPIMIPRSSPEIHF
ncbi:MAG: hypothetical protein SYNGOMJ08_00613 [Candidatus Syntrophoarchaeum sp. GoM_oil]|nr:MAG: hypothetical protein SYNGOMJ08_00613 [Candidatus Syntrophoarchaeum sp. GoM_oil]